MYSYVGFLGSFTTLSALSGDVALLLLNNRMLLALCLLLMQGLGSVIMTLLGIGFVTLISR